MNLKKLFLIILPLLLLQPTISIANETLANFTKNAVSAEITQDGFNLLTELAKEKLLSQLKNRVLGDMDFDLKLISRNKMKDITLSADFEDMKLAPNQDGLDFEVKIKNLVLNIGKIEIRSWWFNRLTICTGTKIQLANNHTVPIKGNFGLKLANGKFSLENRNLDFHLNKNQYIGTGPTDCRKPSGRKKYFTKWILGFAVKKARKLLNSFGKKMIANLLKDKVQELLNTKLSNLKIPVTVPSLFVIPKTKLLLRFKIEKLSLTPNALNIDLSLGANRDDTKSLALDGNEFPDIMRFATISVKPEFANVLFKALIPDRTLPFEITTDLNEMISQMLSKDAWVGFIPDLNLVETDSDNIKLFVSLDAPLLEINEEQKGLLLKTPKVFFELKINKNGEWVDYHTIHLNLETEVNISIEERKLNLEILPLNASAEGVWANNYRPQDETFNQEDTEDGFMGLIEMAGEIIPEIKIPEFKITDGTKMTIGNLKFEDSKVFVDLLGVN